MKAEQILHIYTQDSFVQNLHFEFSNQKHFQLKGLTGSQDMLLLASIYQLSNQKQSLIIAHDKEEAAFLADDLSQLLPEAQVSIFPSSFKRAYQFEETENANVLMRAEILTRINSQGDHNEIIVTYPEALCEKVINKKTLSQNTFSIKRGEQIDIPFLTELLHSYGFEKEDFVYEVGQFAVRGGIVDIFSYSSDEPYRLEFFGDEVESIRIFDPSTQLSERAMERVSLIPNVQTQLMEEERASFLNFLQPDAFVFIKDYELLLDIISGQFAKVSEDFEELVRKAYGTTIVKSPEELFEKADLFKKSLSEFKIMEIGNRFSTQKAASIKLDSSPQPSFNKDFDLLADALEELASQGYTNLIASDAPKQLERLQAIFDEMRPNLSFQGLDLSLRAGFQDHILKIACYTDHQIFERYHKYKLKKTKSRSKALTLKELRTLQPGDFVVHVDHGIGRFAGMQIQEVNGKKQETIRLVYRDNDLLYVNLHNLHKISKYTGKEGNAPAISKLGSQEWENKKRSAKRKVKDIAKELIDLYAKRMQAPGFAFSADSFMQAELESSFIYEDTPDQSKATDDVKTDMEKPHPMDRLVCGDVGFGKTEVAIRAAFKAVTEGKQVAVLVPTTILAMQHFQTFQNRLERFPVKVEFINRFRSAKKIKEILKAVAEGEVNILIGTHRIVNKDVKFKDLGLMIIDEEQKFGVSVKEKLKSFKVNVDSLTLTATPIPRTLHFSLMGARDLSVISTPPPNRQPVTTEIHTFGEEVVRDAVSYEVQRGGQVYFVHNRVADIENLANVIYKLVPEARIGVAHGQMPGPQLEKIMLKFIEGEYDVLVSTNIIESGLDIPNANTIIINHAHMFGLSDLHQMRGRVGRSNKKAFCYLLTPPVSLLTSEARKRLSTLEEFSGLGDGIKVAMRDLDIRGAGNLLGGEQSGFISDLGFDMYHKILEDAVQELKENDFKELFADQMISEFAEMLADECSVETDMEILIPEEYVQNITERLELYSRLDNIEKEEELIKFEKELEDRFGPIPAPVVDLIKTVRLRWIAQRLGIERLSLKNGSIKAYFLDPENEKYYQSDIFGSILQYVQSRPKKCKLKDAKKRLILYIHDIETIEDAISLLQEMLPVSVELEK
ncbi:MAG: transcription-repair coupling factor [Cyclobacteriaceae bacterium]|nr:transcription-repair coupling factor [Cyclobacteriaceae bacterium]MCH8516547.1 transcription-repair coupling factor [Cyclobacteriaceae bacterium]